MGMMKSSNNHLHHQLLHGQYHLISSFNPSCCLRPPPPLLDEPFIACSFTPTSSSSQQRNMRPATKTAATDEAPASPKIGCMGHLKRSKSSRSNSSSGNKKIGVQFRRMFSVSSGKRSATMLMIMSPIPSPSRRLRGRAKVQQQDHCSFSYNAATMDRPLPVPKQRKVVGERSDVSSSLWRRRRGGGDGLQGLDVEKMKVM